MAILTPPSTPGFARGSTFRPSTNTLSFTSALSKSTQTLEFPGAHWIANYALPPMYADLGELWDSFLSELDGPAGRAYLGHPSIITPRGSASSAPGTPLVNGASQTGKSLIIDGASLSATGYLLTGDYFSIDLPLGGRSMHKLVSNVNTDGSGNATFTFRPPLRESPLDGEPIQLSPASCVMRLVDDNQVQTEIDEAGIYFIAFSMIESFNQGI